ncbi:MAG TPA: hypothetical protein P5525_14625 [Candidatus Paceibacterota bacterium]|nr:hypothetical protein [Candidatus Paceibacterota bacterium]
MKVLGFGVDFKGKPLFAPVAGKEFEQQLMAALKRNAVRVRKSARATSVGFSYRSAIKRKVVDMGDPRQAGWSYLVQHKDPQREDYERILAPLARERGMADPAAPLLFDEEGPDEWLDWINDSYYSRRLEGKTPPHYILIVGGPERVPFRFQSLLDTVASVGRLAFDNVDDLSQYVSKVLRLEKADEPTVTREALFFAPDGGPDDPTHFSRRYMVEPMATHVEKDLSFNVRRLVGNQATKQNLVEALKTQRPALVYTASHGLGALGESEETQKRYNGAVCCQRSGGLTMDDLFSGDDVPKDEPFLEGSVFFQFACFGYGTPAQSDYAHWLDGVPKKYGKSDFVAHLPKRLLAHPRGPIAFVGHLDTAFLHAFADPEMPEILDRWHTRIEPFLAAVDRLLADGQASALAMEDMAHRYTICNTLITNTYDRERRGKVKWTPKERASFLDNWITRSDAQNYMVFGDPAARLSIPA